MFLELSFILSHVSLFSCPTISIVSVFFFCVCVVVVLVVVLQASLHTLFCIAWNCQLLVGDKIIILV